MHVKILSHKHNHALDVHAMRCKQVTWRREITKKDPFCPELWDTLQCWAATPANTTIYQKCPESIGFTHSELLAHRTCSPNGTWLHGDWSNYSACLKHVWTGKEPPEIHTSFDIQRALILAYIYFIMSNISLILLLITMFIFCYFRSLHCSRISIHKNLVSSFILRFIIFVIISEPYIMRQNTSYRNVDWLCKSMTIILQYSALANIFWMFVEGLFLHNRIVVSVFNTTAPFKLFYFIGWGIPVVITASWSVIMHYYYKEKCWEKYTTLPFIFIIYVPIIVVLLTNLIFLINIIFVLVTKLRAHNTMESAQIRKAIRATIVLFPLLGITNLLFFAEPGIEGTWKSVYHIANAVLQSSQGIFVALLYCFFNGEVQSVITKKWRRFMISRSMKHSMRRRSSRTSSLFLSQSDVVAMMSIRSRIRNQKQFKKQSSRLHVYSSGSASLAEQSNGKTTISSLPNCKEGDELQDRTNQFL
ncbi:corticotropin-releasing factor receptor 2-like isoform X2 [Octopus sinensis]|uniref:Corticotropin-releasing factor receptor 2-like isoform X2 n=1 Tax=Octopus sinensis TaxID=2607531 RepID=A0A7E6EW83_9MOLL|nr:corticotropin-releasing factor receptor 2-like isoform X2 [Octopus sinensis]